MQNFSTRPPNRSTRWSATRREYGNPRRDPSRRRTVRHRQGRDGRLPELRLSCGDGRDVLGGPRRGRAVRSRQPADGRGCGTADPDDVLDLIAETAWETGDPGLLFLETINEHNPTPHLGRAEATNLVERFHCVPTRPAFSARSTSPATLTAARSTGRKLRETARLGVRFLDNAIEQSEFPVPRSRSGWPRPARWDSV